MYLEKKSLKIFKLPLGDMLNLFRFNIDLSKYLEFQTKKFAYNINTFFNFINIEKYLQTQKNVFVLILLSLVILGLYGVF